jgi:CTP:molybdopterin cytidylyltransferase MocA
VISAIILAAGESSRMGRPKQLLPWGGTTLLDWQVRELRSGGADDVVVVLGHALEEVTASLRETGTDTRIVVNEAYLEGRASSLRRGAESVDDTAEAVIVSSVDQPSPAWVTRRLIAKWRKTGTSTVSLRFGGRGGHPVLLAGRLLPELRHVTERRLGLRGVIESHGDELATLELPDKGLAVNLNTLDDYEAALLAFERGDWREPPD